MKDIDWTDPLTTEVNGWIVTADSTDATRGILGIIAREASAARAVAEREIASALGASSSLLAVIDLLLARLETREAADPAMTHALVFDHDAKGDRVVVPFRSLPHAEQWARVHGLDGCEGISFARIDNPAEVTW